jgi:hypothetical protein
MSGWTWAVAPAALAGAAAVLSSSPRSSMLSRARHCTKMVLRATAATSAASFARGKEGNRHGHQQSPRAPATCKCPAAHRFASPLLMSPQQAAEGRGLTIYHALQILRAAASGRRGAIAHRRGCPCTRQDGRCIKAPTLGQAAASKAQLPVVPNAENMSKGRPLPLHW